MPKKKRTVKSNQPVINIQEMHLHFDSGANRPSPIAISAFVFRAVSSALRDVAEAEMMGFPITPKGMPSGGPYPDPRNPGKKPDDPTKTPGKNIPVAKRTAKKRRGNLRKKKV
jgi:hypothetical protein